MPSFGEPVDYSHEVRVSKNPYWRFALQAAALIFLLLGIIGIFLPLLPTTPFLLLASACYARSSVTFYNRMMNHRRLGPPLRRWREHKAISRQNKVVAIALLALSLGSTILWVVPIGAVKIGLGAIGIAIAGFIATRKENG